MKVISLFSGIGGLDLGFSRRGFQILLGIEINKYAVESLRLNFSETLFIHRDIREVDLEEVDSLLYNHFRFTLSDIDVILGGPPCQAFSTGGRRLGISDTRKDKGGDLVYHYMEFIKQIRPAIFVFENVKGLLSSSIKKMPFYERISKYKKKEDIPYEYRPGSLFEKILNDFSRLGYTLMYKVLNAADYGVPQKRERVFIVGIRNDIDASFSFPDPTHADLNLVSKDIHDRKPWLTLRDSIYDLKDVKNLEFVEFPPSWGKYMALIPPGGCWIDLPEELQQEVLKGAFDTPDDPLKFKKRGGRRGFLRRLSWNKPSPTLLTSPVMKGSVLAHPEKNRPLSVEEYKRIQTFPDDWKVLGSVRTKYKLLGEAVPVKLSEAIAEQVKNFLRSKASIIT